MEGPGASRASPPAGRPFSPCGRAAWSQQSAGALPGPGALREGAGCRGQLPALSGTGGRWLPSPPAPSRQSPEGPPGGGAGARPLPPPLQRPRSPGAAGRERSRAGLGWAAVSGEPLPRQGRSRQRGILPCLSPGIAAAGSAAEGAASAGRERRSPAGVRQDAVLQRAGRQRGGRGEAEEPLEALRECPAGRGGPHVGGGTGRVRSGARSRVRAVPGAVPRPCVGETPAPGEAPAGRPLASCCGGAALLPHPLSPRLVLGSF